MTRMAGPSPLQRALKRVFDLGVAVVALLLLGLPMLLIALAIRLEGPGPVFYRQERVGLHGRLFRIHKFRTMRTDADRIGGALTVGDDPRITAVGRWLRARRFDELPQFIDVLLGDRIMIEVPERPELQIVGISGHTAEDPYWLQPGEFCLAETREIFNLPDHIAAQFVLKSSRAREGLEHLLAGYCDPGWHGSRLTLELQNARRMHPIAIWPGMKIGQMVFHRMSNPPMRSYAQTGRYNNHSTVKESLG